MNARKIAAQVLGYVAAGMALSVAVFLVGSEENISTTKVTQAIRTTRYVLYNESNGVPNSLCGDDKPEDVECVAYGWTAEKEAARSELLASMRQSVSALPAVMVYAETPQLDDDGSVVGYVSGWREYRVADLPRDQRRWRDGPSPENRRAPVAEWALLRAAPPPVVINEDAL